MHPPTRQAQVFCAVCGILLAIMAREIRAQKMSTTTAVPAENSAKHSPASSATENPPPGSCTPIGITVSGEVVFPYLCKDFIDRHKAAKQGAGRPDNHDLAPRIPPAKQPDNAASKPATESPDTGIARPATRSPQTMATPPVTKAPESVAATAETEPPQSVASIPAPETVASTPATEAPAKLSATPEANSEPMTPRPEEPRKHRPKPARSAENSATLEKGSPSCKHFRTYDPSSHTYRSYEGRRRSCP